MASSTKFLFQATLLFVFIAMVHSGQDLFTGPRPTFTTATSTVTPKNKCAHACRDLSIPIGIMRCANCTRVNFTLKDLGKPTFTPTFTWGIKITRPNQKVITKPTITTTLSKSYERLCKECLQYSMKPKLCHQVCQAWLNAQTTPTLAPRPPAVFRNGKTQPRQPTAKPSESEIKVTRITEKDLISTLLEYREREFWFVAFAFGCVIVLLLLIVIMFCSHKRRTHKIVKPRMDFCNI
eukprot:TCONS_00047550-protein